MDVERLRSLAISDTGFVFDPSTGESYSTNAVGTRIIGLLKEGHEVEAVVDRLGGEYEVAEAELEADVQDFVESLRSLRLVA